MHCVLNILIYAKYAKSLVALLISDLSFLCDNNNLKSIVIVATPVDIGSEILEVHFLSELTIVDRVDNKT